MGLALAAAAWFALGGGAGMTAPLDQLDRRLAAARPPALHGASLGEDLAARAAASPLFALTTGPGAVADVTVQLQGLAITPRRKAALISIGGKPSDWLDLGSSRDGVTLMAVQSTKVTVDTATGFKEVGLWDSPTAAGSPAASAPGAGPPPAVSSDRIPPGAHLPPPPASAPGRGG